MSDDSGQLRDNFLRYVTGGMEPEEVLSFEERLVGDLGFSDAAALCEQELIDAYAAGELNEADTTALQHWLEGSPRRMQRVQLARSLQEIGRRKVQRQWSMRLVLPIAAVIAGLAVLTWMTGRRFVHHPEPASDAVAQKGVPAGSERPPEPPSSPAAPEQVILVVAERVRGDMPAQLVTPQRGSAVALQVLLPADAADSPYRIRVAKSEGSRGAVLDQRGVRPVVTRDRLVLNAHLPGDALTPGSYTVVVDGAQESFVSRMTVHMSSDK